MGRVLLIPCETGLIDLTISELQATEGTFVDDVTQASEKDADIVEANVTEAHKQAKILALKLNLDPSGKKTAALATNPRCWNPPPQAGLRVRPARQITCPACNSLQPL